MAEESILRPFYTVLVLAFICSALVAGAAVGLRPQQDANRDLDRKKHILYAAGLFREGKSIDDMFKPIETRIIDLKTGKFVPENEINPTTYQQQKAALSESTGRALNNQEDIARLRRLEKYSLVYLVKKDGGLDQIVLPVRGKGLWSTMYAFVAIAADLSTIRGVSFYQHGETPGLGGEVENPKWQQGWQGKHIYNDQDNVELKFTKGKAATDGPEQQYQIDGLSGATLTTNGVNNLMEFWFGNHGFKPFFKQLKKEGSTHG
jgi:Na+-transporting NADH:ubiquinone oxidoreductase subunit C